MIKENFKIYKVFCVVFLFLNLGLIYISFFNIRDIKIRQKVDDGDVVKIEKEKKYGYIDILDLINKDENINVTNITNSVENKDIIKLSISYDGDIINLYSTLKSFQNTENFYRIENITLNNNNNIILTAVFLKNK